MEVQDRQERCHIVEQELLRQPPSKTGSATAPRHASYQELRQAPPGRAPPAPGARYEQAGQQACRLTSRQQAPRTFSQEGIARPSPRPTGLELAAKAVEALAGQVEGPGETALLAVQRNWRAQRPSGRAVNAPGERHQHRRRANCSCSGRALVSNRASCRRASQQERRQR